MKERMERKASDNEYFHRDFHISADQGVRYVGDNFGDDAVKAYLEQFAVAYYKPLIEEIKKVGLSALEKNIKEVYKKEKAEDALKTDLEKNSLLVNVAYCPAVKYMKSQGYTPSKWYIETTRTVFAKVAEETGYHFNMEFYDEETGKTSYSFTKEVQI